MRQLVAGMDSRQHYYALVSAKASDVTLRSTQMQRANAWLTALAGLHCKTGPSVNNPAAHAGHCCRCMSLQSWL